MTDEVQPGESRRDIAGNSLRALRAARGGEAPDPGPTAGSGSDGSGDSDGSAEAFDDLAELTDDPAVQPDDLPAGSPEEAYADEVLDAETEAETADADTDAAAAGHHDTDDPTIDDPAELTDDPSGLPDSPADAVAADDNADTTYADEVLDAETEADPADAETDAAAAGHDNTDDTTIDDPAELTDEPPTLAAATLRARRSKVSIAKSDAAESSESASTDGAATGTRRPARTRRRPAPMVIALAAVTAAALVFAVVSAVVWYRADNDGAREIATARDEVATSARLAVATVNTVDYSKADASLDNWLTVSTGKFRSEVSDSKRSAAKVLAQAKVSTTAVVLDAAVTSLDTAKGTATVIAAVNIKKTPLGKASATDPRRVRASMKLVNGEWKLADLGEVAGAVFQ